MRYDGETGLYWMSVRAYDPTLGRFLSHDPLGRLAMAGLDTEPYVYVGNNPLVHVDPTGMRPVDVNVDTSDHAMQVYAQRRRSPRIRAEPPCDKACQIKQEREKHVIRARDDAATGVQGAQDVIKNAKGIQADLTRVRDFLDRYLGHVPTAVNTAIGGLEFAIAEATWIRDQLGEQIAWSGFA